MGAFGVVVPAPGRERGAGMVQGREQRFIQQLITQSAVEALDEEQLRAMGSSEPATVRHGRQRHPGPRYDGPLAPPPAAEMRPLFAIDAAQAFVVHRMPLTEQEHMQLAVAEPTVRLQPVPQHRIVLPDRLVAHGHAAAADHPARPPFAHPVTRHQMRDRLPLRGGRRHFFPSRSCSAALSGIASASRRFSFAFLSASGFPAWRQTGPSCHP